MATLKLNSDKLKQNHKRLEEMFAQHNLDWAIVTKLLSGNELFLKEVLDLGPAQVCDSRISNLRKIKMMNPKLETIYIKPVPMGSIPKLLEVADISFNSEITTLKAISEASLRMGKKHKVIIAIELGDLREGIMGDDILDFFAEVFCLEGIEVVGLGANLNCMNGVMPSEEKLDMLIHYRSLVEEKFQKKIPLLSGGSSVTIPLMRNGEVPDAINHFRVGESLYFGADLLNECELEGFHQDVFEIEAEIIEMTVKPTIPTGTLAKNLHGEVFEINPEDEGRSRCQVLIDIGSLDISSKYLVPCDPEVQVIGSSSDMTVLEIPMDSETYKVGSVVKFKASYMVVLGLMNSQYVTKSLTGMAEDEAREMDRMHAGNLARSTKINRIA